MQAGDNNSSNGLPSDTGIFEGLPRWVILTIKAAVGLIVFAVLYFLLDFLRSVYTNWLWFNNVGFLDVYTTKLYAQLLLYLIGSAGSTTAIYFTYHAA